MVFKDLFTGGMTVILWLDTGVGVLVAIGVGVAVGVGVERVTAVAPVTVTTIGVEAIPLATTYMCDGPFSTSVPIVKLKVDGTIEAIDVVLNPDENP